MTVTALPVQRPVGADGLLLHEGDHVAQLALALENLEQALAAAGLAPTDLVRLHLDTTDRALLEDAFEVLTERLLLHGVRPTVTVSVVPRLDQPGMTVSVRATAGSHHLHCVVPTSQGESS